MKRILRVTLIVLTLTAMVALLTATLTHIEHRAVDRAIERIRTMHDCHPAQCDRPEQVEI